MNVLLNPSRSAFRNGMFRVFIGGSTLYRTGDWMDFVAINWIALQAGGSGTFLGLVNLCRLLPIFLVSLPAGTLADRYDRRMLLIYAQAGSLVLTLGLSLWMAIDGPLWLFLALIAARSVFSAMETPVTHALLPNLVREQERGSAIAWNSAVLNLSRIIGPAVAGVMLTTMAPSIILWINAASTLAMILVVTAVKPLPSAEEPGRAAIVQDSGQHGTREAWRYIRSEPAVQSLLLLAVAPMVFGFPYTSMLPLFTQELLGFGTDKLGQLLSVSGAGSLLCSLWLSLGREARWPGRWLVLSLLGFGVSLCGFMAAPAFGWAAAAMFAAGLFGQAYRTMSRIAMQQQVPDRLRGRIMSIALMDRGFIPLGALLIGLVADMAGVLTAGLLMGTGCVAITVGVLAWRRELWRM